MSPKRVADARMGVGMWRGGTSLIEQVESLEVFKFQNLKFSNFQNFKGSKFQSFKVSKKQKLHFMCLIDIDPISNILKKLLNESSGLVGPHIFQKKQNLNFQ